MDVHRSPFYELSYDEINRIGTKAYAKRHRKIFARQLYLTKNPDWVSEQEYRFVWIGGEETDVAEYVSIEGCVNAICLGTRFPDVYGINVREIRDSLGIAVYQVSYMYGKIQILPLFA